MFIVFSSSLLSLADFVLLFLTFVLRECLGVREQSHRKTSLTLDSGTLSLNRQDYFLHGIHKIGCYYLQFK